MKNINYDLLKLLHTKLDTVWRLEKHYIGDAEVAKCHSLKAMEQMLEADKKQIAMLNEEIKMRMDAGEWD
jgi:hypothetical protein